MSFSLVFVWNQASAIKVQCVMWYWTVTCQNEWESNTCSSLYLNEFFKKVSGILPLCTAGKVRHKDLFKQISKVVFWWWLQLQALKPTNNFPFLWLTLCGIITTDTSEVTSLWLVAKMGEKRVTRLKNKNTFLWISESILNLLKVNFTSWVNWFLCTPPKSLHCCKELHQLNTRPCFQLNFGTLLKEEKSFCSKRNRLSNKWEQEKKYDPSSTSASHLHQSWVGDVNELRGGLKRFLNLQRSYS